MSKVVERRIDVGHVPLGIVVLPVVLMLVLLFGPAVSADEPKSKANQSAHAVQLDKTKSGIRFGIWPAKPQAPAPTLFILASTIDGSLGQAYFRQSGNLLAKRGYLCVSVDLPCHGMETKPGEPNGLDGWAFRAKHNDDFVADTTARLKQVLDHLIAAGYTDAKKVAACGTSRGGFIALQFAAADPRVKCVAAFAPVTDLAVLREFKNSAQYPLVRSLDVSQQVDKLAGRAVWLVIGDQDARVGTDQAITFCRRLTAASLKQKVPSQVELHVMAEPRGHTTPAGSSELAAEWIHRHIERKTP